jgi:acetylornithine deacetylase/succinyl-diaminopimelate desuccinylase-like protein
VAVRDLADLIRVRNDVNDPRAIRDNAAAIRARLERRGLEVRFLETESGVPAVYAELRAPESGRRPTVLVYSHYDGVPPGAGWESDPYEPTLREPPSVDGRLGAAVPWSSDASPDPEWRLYGRSAADSKHAVVALLAAVDYVRERQGHLGVNLKLLLDGEEERESPGLPGIIARHAELLRADLVLSASGEMHPSGRPTIIGGVRGILLLELTVVTASSLAHSGHFGGVVPNAAFALARVLGTLKGDDGHVRVPGFYDEVRSLDQVERMALAPTPPMDSVLRGQFGFHQPEITDHRWHELLARPTLNVRGMAAGAMGAEAANIVPHRARAELDIRLVADMDPGHTQALLQSHLRAVGASVLDHEPSHQELLDLPRIVIVRRLASCGGEERRPRLTDDV